MFNLPRILFIFLFLSVPGVSSALELQILLTHAHFPAVYFSDADIIIEDGKENLYQINNKHNLNLSMSGQELTFERNKFTLPVTMYNRDNRFFINGKGYRGKLRVKYVDGKHVFINVIDLEDYLRGVVSKEMPATWPLEALKAQAVIARTYAIYKATKTNRIGFDLYDSTLDQVYYGLEGESSTGDIAVTYTKDIILLHNNDIIKSYYHSTSGGRTEAPKEVWGDDYPYLESTVCGYDRDSPSFSWEYSIKRSELESLLKKAGFPAKKLLRIRPEDYTVSGRNRRINLFYQDHTNAQISGVDLRQLVGNTRVKSTKFQVLNRDNSFLFRGKGSGHGVGLCQWGARGMAEKGFTFQEILRKYYRDITLSTLSDLHGTQGDFIDKALDDAINENSAKPESIPPFLSEEDNLGSFLDQIDETSVPPDNRIHLDEVVR